MRCNRLVRRAPSLDTRPRFVVGSIVESVRNTVESVRNTVVERRLEAVLHRLAVVRRGPLEAAPKLAGARNPMAVVCGDDGDDYLSDSCRNTEYDASLPFDGNWGRPLQTRGVHCPY